MSAVGFLLVFAITAYGGANIFAFELLKGGIDSLRGASIDSTLRPISAWKHTFGVATEARRLALKIISTETPADITGVQNALDEIVKASPTSVDAWQARVPYLQAGGAPMERVLAAFRMSALTGSHEGYFMAERAVFGLENWTQLPEADRRIVVRDVLRAALVRGLWENRDRCRAILAEKSDAERDDIRVALSTSGLASKDALQALGL